MKRILCYGDSNTYGYNPENGDRYEYRYLWTSILQDKLGDEYEIINEGLNGRTTAYDRTDSEEDKNGLTTFLPYLKRNKPIDLVAIMLGTNDCNKTLNLTVNDIARGMELLIETIEDNMSIIQGYVPRIIVVTPEAIGEDYENSPFKDELDDDSIIKSKEIAPLYEEVAKKHGCMYLNCVGKLKISKLDCEHLTKLGHQRLATLLYEMIIKAFNSCISYCSHPIKVDKQIVLYR